MRGDRERWDEKHARSHGGLDPSAFLAALLPHLPGKTGPSPASPPRALDLACGKGPDTLLLARAGYLVDAWDISPVALRALSERASAEGLDALVRCREVDLSDADLPSSAYDLVLCRRFLDRSLLPKILAAPRPGGALVLETFIEEQALHPHGPKSPAFLLRYGELRQLLPPADFELLRWYEEGGSLLGRSMAGVAGLHR